MVDNLELADRVIKKSLLIERGEVYGHEVIDLVWDEYHELSLYEEGRKLTKVIFDLNQITTLSNFELDTIITNVGLNYFSTEENIVRYRLIDNIQKFIIDNWERGDFSQEIDIILMGNRVNNDGLE